MPESAPHPMLELLSCECMHDLLARFSARIETLAPGCSQISGLILPQNSGLACQVTGNTPGAIYLTVDDFTHPLAQVIRSGKPAVWLSLNYGARIEHSAFRELVQRQKGECGLYAVPLLDGQGGICGIWAILASSAVIGDLLNVESLFSTLLQVFQLRSQELSKTRIQIEHVASVSVPEAEPWCISRQYVQGLLDALHHDKPVMIMGESGTGKTWLAQYMHRCSPDAASLVSLDCAVLTEEWQGIKIFGDKSVAGSALVKAHRGFLLIENIDMLAPRWHGHFQHFVDTHEVLSCDGRDSGTVALKLILTGSGPNHGRDDLKQNHASFYHRLAGVEMYLPPLRERKQDLKTVAECILKASGHRRSTDFSLSAESIDDLLCYSYPGNVRELENILQNYIFVVQAEGIDAGINALREKTRERNTDMFSPFFEPQNSGALKMILARYEAVVLRQRLQKYNFDKERTAASLSISRRSLDMKCKKSRIVR